MAARDVKNPHKYKATKLWNEILFAFRFGLPLKRHRRHMKVYEECFTGSEAIDWLHDFLLGNPNFGQHVTRTQTVELLKKFYKSDVFKEIKKSKRETFFSDSGCLYRFCDLSKSPQRTVYSNPSRPPLAVLNSVPLREAILQKAQKPTSQPVAVSNEEHDEQENVPLVYNSFAYLLWKKLVLRRLMAALNVITLDGILDGTKISGQTIVHNMIRLDRNGVVAILDKSDDLPHWILLALKCLALWPNASGNSSCLPNYHGFPVDVFHVIKEYFSNQNESLIPQRLCKLFRLVLLSSRKEPASLPKSLPDESSLSRHDVAKIEGPHQLVDCRTSSSLEKQFLHSCSSRLLTRRSISLPRLNPPVPVESTVNPVESHEIHTSMPSHLDSINSLEELNRSHFYRNEAFCFGCNSSSSLDDSSPNLNDAFSEAWETSARKTAQIAGYCKGAEYKIREPLLTEESESKLQQENCDFINSLTKSEFEMENAGTERIGARTSDWDVPELIKRLQVCTLLLDPPSRRKLHLTLQFLLKISQNESLELQLHQSLKSLMVETFAQCVVHFPEINSNEEISETLTSFLIDYVEQVFAPPSDLADHFRNVWQLHCQRQQQISCEENAFGTKTYCEQLTRKMYEEQMNSASRGALCQLLRDIQSDPALPDKQRHRKLIEFKKNHPDIYYSEFPNLDKKCPSNPQEQQQIRMNLITRIKKFRL